MSDRQHILNSIAALAKRLGHTPSLVEFVAHTGTCKHSVFRLFPRWNEAVRAAGLEPRRLYARPRDEELLEDWGETVRKKGRLLTRSAYRIEGRYYPRTLEKRFGGWASIPEAFRKFAKGKRRWADVVALLPTTLLEEEKQQWKEDVSTSDRWSKETHTSLKDRCSYGNPIDFPGLRHEPVNEQGVVLLFGMLAKDLGYVIEAAQHGFPDCEAKRRVGPERWQRVRIEFEFESRNFWEHGHPASGCDVIVCWRHNWKECPENIEVVELSSVIKSLANVED
jgi:hypothetical protein